MKRLFSIIVVCLMAFLFVGCDSIVNQIKDGMNNGGDGDDEPKSEDKLEMTQQESEEKFQEIAGNGYEITFVYTSKDDEGEETGTMTMGAKGNVSWISDNGERAAFVEEESVVHVYSYTEEDGYKYELTYNMESVGQAMSVSQGILTPYLYWANNYDGSLKKGADASVAGRSCYTYELDYSAMIGAYAQMEGISNLKYKIYVDKTLGITMKVEASATSDGVTASFSYEVTSFKQGSEVTAPRLPEPTPAEEE